MGKHKKITVNQRFGRLVAVKKLPKSPSTWLFNCDCGNSIEVLEGSVKSGRTKSCGCLRKEKLREMASVGKDEINNRYGKLTVLREVPKPADSPPGFTYWLCQCDCGNTKIVAGYLLRAGKVKSCGCLKRGRPKIEKNK
ncbi:MAG: hypothetical protein ACTSVB_11395 [Candidatus Heimdallarchaeaceae archaeon]